VDCNTARMLATFFGRQGSELAPEDAAALETHLTACPQCAAQVQFERAFDDRVGKAMLAVPIPAGLKSKLLDGVYAQRGSWYRQKAYALVGMAACALVAVGGVVAWQIGTARELTKVSIVAHEDDYVQDRTRMIDDVLGPRGLRFDPERRFDLNQLEMAGIGRLHGKEVPVLYFVNVGKNARAKVYVIRDADFAWRNLSGNESSVLSTYGHQVAVLKDLKRSDVGYVVVFTGAGLELFLEDRSSL
jgi:hypothetical protein